MIRVLIGLLAVVTLTAFAPAPLPRKEGRGGDVLSVGNLLGGYKAIRLLSSGNKTPQDPASNGVGHVTITTTHLIFNKPSGNPVEYELRIDHTKNPVEVNLYNKGQADSGTPYGTGILKREGGNLRLVYNWTTSRPTDFENLTNGWDLTLQRE